MGNGISVIVDDQADDDLAQADQVDVWERMGAPTTYRLRLPVDIQGGDLPRLIDRHLDPGSELTILEPVGDATQCLVKGPVRGQYIHLEHGGDASWVEVSGSDTTLKMDRETRAVIWADVKDSEAASSVLNDRSYGYSLDVQDTNAGHYEEKHVLVQRETDYHFVRRLASRNGFLLWITCDAQGAETAHFRRPPLDGDSVATLLINVDGANLKTVEIAWDVERPSSVTGAGLDANSKEVLDGSVAATPQTILGARSLQAITGDTRSAHLPAPADDAADLQARGEGLLIQADWFVRLTCQTSLYGLGQLVRAHTVVQVDGLGTRYSGKYFVAAVHHVIDASAHVMNLTLVRNAWSA
jgi:phage protein D